MPFWCFFFLWWKNDTKGDWSRNCLIVRDSSAGHLDSRVPYMIISYHDKKNNRCRFWLLNVVFVNQNITAACEIINIFSACFCDDNCIFGVLKICCQLGDNEFYFFQFTIFIIIKLFVFSCWLYQVSFTHANYVMKKWRGLELILNIQSTSYLDRESDHPVKCNDEEKFHF